MQMPGMDGRELAGRIKADPDLARVRLVLLTSRDAAAKKLAGPV
jgi:CheY-like chemotaxis protein